jgi:putative transposase
MYKKIELLSKKDHLNLRIDKIDGFEFAKELKYAPLGLSEIAKLSTRFPVFITGGEDNHFAVLLAVGNNDNYFSLNRKYEDKRFIPIFLKTYPFLMVEANEEDGDKKFRAVALDVGSSYIGEDKSFQLFQNQDNGTNALNQRVKLVKDFDKDRFHADELVTILKKLDLLDKRDITLKLDDGEPKTILSDFFVVNQERLYKLNDKVLLDWTKKGWMFLLENHMRSIENVDLLLAQSMIQKDNNK